MADITQKICYLFSILDDSLESQNLKIRKVSVQEKLYPCPSFNEISSPLPPPFHEALPHTRVELRLGDSCILKWVNSWLVSWSLSKILDVQLLPSKERIPPLAGRACLFFLVKKSSGAARGVHPKGLTASRGGSNLSLWAPLSPRFVSTLVPGSRQRKPALINTLQLSTCQHVFWSYL